MNGNEAGLYEKILATAKRLFVAKGYHGMSMREISEALGVSKAALYYHFKDKEELFLAILRAYLNEMSSLLDQITAEPLPSREKIRVFVETVLTQPAEQRATIRLASQEINQLSPEARRAFGELYRDHFIHKIGVILQQGMDQGDFRRIPEEVAVWALLGIMFPYFYPNHAAGAPIPAETIEQITQIFLDGISNRPGLT
jgi:AcrR family transcriptional regulator